MAKKQITTAVAVTTAVESQIWRVVVRGNLAKASATHPAGTRVRRCKNVPSDADGSDALAGAGEIALEVATASGLVLDSVFFNVYPPVGILVNGGVSKGFEKLPSGMVARIKAAA